MRNNDDHNEEGIINCEICKVIKKLGLPKSAHQLWFCTDNFHFVPTFTRIAPGENQFDDQSGTHGELYNQVSVRSEGSAGTKESVDWKWRHRYQSWTQVVRIRATTGQHRRLQAPWAFYRLCDTARKMG